MTCVNSSSCEDLLTDEVYYDCGCNPYIKISESSTPFDSVTADISFVETNATTTSSNSTDTADVTTESKGLPAYAWILIALSVIVVAGLLFIFIKNRKNTGEVHEEGGDYDNMFTRI